MTHGAQGSSATGQLGETDLKLLGNLDGKRVLELGSHAAVAFARGGARVIAVDNSAERLDEARALAAEHEVKLELQHGDLADLARLRPESVDAAYSCYALQHIEDLGRLFRQVHRVLGPETPFVFSLPHPWASLIASDEAGRQTLTGSYFDRTVTGGDGAASYRHTIADVHNALTRSNFNVDALVEPRPATGGPGAVVPRSVIWRARKVGL